jgi:chromosome segregation ATPase
MDESSVLQSDVSSNLKQLSKEADNQRSHMTSNDLAARVVMAISGQAFRTTAEMHTIIQGAIESVVATMFDEGYEQGKEFGFKSRDADFAEKDAVIKHYDSRIVELHGEIRRHEDKATLLREDIDRLEKKADAQRAHINTLVLKNNSQLEAYIVQKKEIIDLQNRLTAAGEHVNTETRSLKADVARWKEAFRSEACRKNVEIDELARYYTVTVAAQDIGALSKAKAQLEQVVSVLLSHPEYNKEQAVEDLSKILAPLGSEIYELKDKLGRIKHINLQDWSERYNQYSDIPPPKNHMLMLIQSLMHSHTEIVQSSLRLVEDFKVVKDERDKFLEANKGAMQHVAGVAAAFTREAGPQ